MFTVETENGFFLKWRKLDTDIDLADVELEIAKERKDTEMVAAISKRLTGLQHDMQDLIGSEMNRILKDEDLSLRDLVGITVIVAGRFMSVTMYEMEPWQKDSD
ncbi:MAG: hypothetical protein IID05_04885 [Gemmatimonadetes bacterium]|nr:hypothetical protein [Gemmatimonadota bacterium]